MPEIQELLQPVSDEQPSGEDLSYDLRMLELEDLFRGKEETQFSEAEPPNWKELRKNSEAFLVECKHLRVAMYLVHAYLRLDKIAGLRRGLELIRGLVENFWPTLYPMLDEVDQDPIERSNILAETTSYEFTQFLAELDLANSPADTYSLHRITTEREAVTGDEREALDDTIRKVFANADVPRLRQMADDLQNCITHLDAVNSFLDTTVGALNAPNLDKFHETLSNMIRMVRFYAGDALAENSAELGTDDDTSDTESSADTDDLDALLGDLDTSSDDDSDSDSAPSPSAAKPSKSGKSPSGVATSSTIASTSDVLRTLDALCEYYKLHEPSSPVPYLLRRARRFAEMDFMQIIDEIHNESRDQFELILGRPS